LSAAAGAHGRAAPGPGWLRPDDRSPQECARTLSAGGLDG